MRMTIFGKMKRTGEDAVMNYFKILSWYSPGGTEKNHKNDLAG
jgi:hypothetical protein